MRVLTHYWRQFASVRNGPTDYGGELGCNAFPKKKKRKKAIDASLIQHCGICNQDQKWYQGRGKVTIRKTTTKGSAALNRDKEVLQDNHISLEARNLQRQAARVSQLADLYKVRAKANLVPLKAIAVIRHAQDTMQAIVNHHDPSNHDEHTFAKAITLLNFTEPLHIAQIRKHGQELRKRAEVIINANAGKGRRQLLAEKLHDPHLKQAFKQLNTSATPPITHLRRDKCDDDECVGSLCGKQGGIATHPDEVDSILRKAWSKVYYGTGQCISTLVAKFLSKYASSIRKAPEHEHTLIDAVHFQNHCMHIANTAGGLDGWRPEDLKLLSPMVFKRMTDILNAIEAGAPWPTPLLNGRAAFLAKDPEQLEDPLGYRPLLVLPVLYRCWAGYRLHSLQPWVKEWCTANTFAGVPLMGADDAWWTAGIQLEHDRLNSVPFAGASADIQKCFDQVVRPLLYALALLATTCKCIIQLVKALDNLTSDGAGSPRDAHCQ